jgi:hypothetical protein
MGLTKTDKVFTPKVTYFEKENRMMIEGQSRQADPSMFYGELWQQIEFYLEGSKNKFTLEFKLEYISSGSSKWILHILKNLQMKYYGKKSISIKWWYEEDDEVILETGEVYKNLLLIPIDLNEY